jgi:glutathione S-transferase
VVTECGAICVYLADNHPRAQLAPALHDPARGSYLRWLFFAAGCLEPALVDRAFQREPVQPSALAYGSYDDALDTLELELTTGPYVLGERFSAADVYLGSEISWGAMIQALEPRPRFAEYAQRLAERPAFKRFSAHNRTLAEQLTQESAA